MIKKGLISKHLFKLIFKTKLLNTHSYKSQFSILFWYSLDYKCVLILSKRDDLLLNIKQNSIQETSAHRGV